MSRTVTLTDPAFEDLRRNARWWAQNRDQRQAERWYDGFLVELETLAEHAERCPLARENPKFDYELRELYYGVSARPTHRALFTIRGEEVLVLAIRHGAQQDVTPDELPS